MKTKIKNWLEKHEMIYGVGLLIVSLCAVAFGGAYLGANAALANTEVTVNVCPVGELASE
jgi:predicted ATPase